MGYTVTVDIKSSSFPELGNPYNPKSYDSVRDNLPKEVKSKVKDQYTSYTKNSSKVSGKVSSIEGYDTPISSSKNIVNDDELCVQFTYEDGSPKTYKFLGMDIDENYNAIIKVGDGYIVVAPMFDANAIKNLSVPDRYNRYDSTSVDYANSIISKSTPDLARTLSTSMKTGALYDIYRNLKSNSASSVSISDTFNVSLENLSPLVDIIKSKAFFGNDDGTSYKFKSILLNLVNTTKKREQEIKSAEAGNSDGLESTVSTIILYKIFGYWDSVISKYTAYHDTLSELDLWSNLGKSCLGDNEFNSRMKSSISIIDQTTGEMMTDKIVSFAGISKDGGISDSDTFRSSVSSQISNLRNLLCALSYEATVSMQDLMICNIDNEEFSNPYDLSAEELQAVSSYDSLRYVDEEAKSCMESYDMNDPEERSLFIKSAIKSYDRNFRAYKSQDDYDVAQAFSDMIENGVTFSDKIISKDDVPQGSEDLSNYEVTSSSEELNRNNIKKSLVKVGKLLNRSLTDVYDLFGSKPQTQSQNP